MSERSVDGSAHRRKAQRGGKRKQPPSANTTFEMKIRADDRLSERWRFLWYWTAQTHPPAPGKHGYMMASEQYQATQLSTNVRQIVDNKNWVIDELGLFRECKGKAAQGVHRPKQYERAYLPDETPDEFVRRVQSLEGMDLCLGLHWLACAATVNGDTAKFSATGFWQCSDEALRKARNRMNELGYFRVRTRRGRGRLARYTRCRDHGAASVHDNGRVIPKAKRQVADDGGMTDKQRYNLEIQQQNEAASRRDLANAMGVNLDGTPKKGLVIKLTRQELKEFDEWADAEAAKVPPPRITRYTREQRAAITGIKPQPKTPTSRA